MPKPIETKLWQRFLSVALLVVGVAAFLAWPQVFAPRIDVLLRPIGLGLLVVILVVAAFGLLTAEHKPMRRAYAVVVGVTIAALASGLLTDLMSVVLRIG